MPESPSNVSVSSDSSLTFSPVSVSQTASPSAPRSLLDDLNADSAHTSRDNSRQNALKAKVRRLELQMRERLRMESELNDLVRSKATECLDLQNKLTKCNTELQVQIEVNQQLRDQLRDHRMKWEEERAALTTSIAELNKALQDKLRMEQMREEFNPPPPHVHHHVMQQPQRKSFDGGSFESEMFTHQIEAIVEKKIQQQLAAMQRAPVPEKAPLSARRVSTKTEVAPTSRIDGRQLGRASSIPSAPQRTASVTKKSTTQPPTLGSSMKISTARSASPNSHLRSPSPGLHILNSGSSFARSASPSSYVRSTSPTGHTSHKYTVVSNKYA